MKLTPIATGNETIRALGELYLAIANAFSDRPEQDPNLFKTFRIKQLKEAMEQAVSVLEDEGYDIEVIPLQ